MTSDNTMQTRNIVKATSFLLVFLLLSAFSAEAQSKLSAKWEELTAADFITAIHQAQGVCLLPFGIIEKHGLHLPLGTDLINVRYATEKSVEQEYAVIFPPYYFGQIAEARQQPGTLSYSRNMQLELLQQTTDEMARNGCKKVVIVNGHGGNEDLLPYFAQTQLDQQHDYVVYIYRWEPSKAGRPQMRSSLDMHAGEGETAHTMISRPDLVHQDRAKEESGEDMKRLNLPPGVYTGIWWYARFPNHYAGDGSVATRELGEFDMKDYANGIAAVTKAVKADSTSLNLQNEFFEHAKRPLETRQ